MAYKVNSLEEMPNALSYLIESVEVLQSKVNALQHGKSSVSCPLKPSDSAPLKHSTMPP